MTGIDQDPIRAAFAAAEPVDLAPPPDGVPGEMAGPGDEPPLDAYVDEAPEVQAALFPLTDYGNGQRLVHYYGDNFLWVPRLGWFRWDGKRWASDEDEILVRRDAQRISARIEHEIPFIALDEWQREALELWRECRDECQRLEKIRAKDMSDEDAQRLAEIQPIKAAGEQAWAILKGAQKRHRDHARTSGNSGKISNMLLEASRAEGVATPVTTLNSDPMMLAVENGVLHFTKRPEDAADAPSWRDPGEVAQVDLLPHDRRHRISKIASAAYDPDAACLTWLAFLERVLPDPEVRAFIKRWFGYCLTGITSEQKLVFLYGGGRNGKSTMVDTIADIMADYGSTIPIETLTGSEQRKGSDATPDLVRLPGARFVRASEPEQGQKMKEALIKALTGGEAIMIRRMMQEFVEIVPEFKLTISGNYKPEVRGADDGIWRRIMLVPFLEQIGADEVDPMLPQKLKAERDGILAWMVEGCLEWMETGLRPPDVIAQATEDYRRDSDPMRLFLETECEITGSAEDFETGRDLGRAFNAWLLDAGTSVWGMRQTANGLKRRAENVKGPNGMVFKPAKRSTTGYLGVRLTTPARDRIAQYSGQLGGDK
ncbi:DNA primase family protein [Phaeobacter gallaeciensis]|uniref:DNA primase family protein n=1 Tax=Phaeobacter gallaeciensis TaxID=60890 RepID=UPI00237F7438|nr:DNA primase family protein [Phaeobacter gallaeciensis]MDE4059759.1 phage/plasmid primase, P4 family [Phaeobacter gallaeciensis]MDE4122604.1 phage/plasmid primase, P4 family [Phaeobacter gallaeciensis]MDE4127246.1 phage/plasmid primase, P4 family [Phaeobacter gallaeciensis]